MAVKRVCFCDPGPNVVGFEARPYVGAVRASARSEFKKIP